MDEREPLNYSRPTLTDALDDEWFRDTENRSLVVCLGCGAIVLKRLRERHWRFHLQITGNVHR